jgi:ribosomal protein L1
VTYNPTEIQTVSLPAARWSTIRTAVLCLACDERTKGNDADADYLLAAYDALKKAMDE